MPWYVALLVVEEKKELASATCSECYLFSEVASFLYGILFIGDIHYLGFAQESLVNRKYFGIVAHSPPNPEKYGRLHELIF